MLENLKKAIAISIPLEIKVFSDKFIRLHELDNFDSFETCKRQIEENIIK